MKNRYTELRQRQRQEVNALPIGFAFSDRQFEEMMRGWASTRRKTSTKSTGSAERAATTRKPMRSLSTTRSAGTTQSCRPPSRRTRPGRASSTRCSSASWTTTSTATRWTRRRRWTRWGTRQTRCWPTRASRGALRKPSRRFAGGVMRCRYLHHVQGS